MSNYKWERYFNRIEWAKHQYYDFLQSINNKLNIKSVFLLISEYLQSLKKIYENICWNQTKLKTNSIQILYNKIKKGIKKDFWFDVQMISQFEDNSWVITYKDSIDYIITFYPFFWLNRFSEKGAGGLPGAHIIPTIRSLEELVVQNVKEISVCLKSRFLTIESNSIRLLNSFSL